MALSPEQLHSLATLADQWPLADVPTRATLRQAAQAQGATFARAFEAMVEQLDAADDRTLLPPITPAQRPSTFSALALPTAPPDERQAGQHVGPYRLVKELGRGGMGVVWLAERADGQHTRQVALKMPLVENLNWLLAARFARERNILASLEHPRIARLYDAGMEGGTQPYIAIEYVKGIPITEYVKTHKLRPEAVVALFAKVIEAVAHAHTQLVIHRDIKPSNILVDARGEPHLLDFGIAKLLDDDEGHSVQATQLTQLSGRALTLDYASPEQVNNAALSTATDVYSLGVVLYELLTGSRPYHPAGPARRDLEQAILDQDAPKPSEQLRSTGDSESGKTARRIRGDLDTIVLTALRKDPRQRYASAQAFADDLKRYLAFEPIQARPASATYKLRKWLRRQRVPLAIAAMGCVAVAAIGVRAWQQQQVAQDSQTQAKAVGGLLQSVFKGMSPDVAAMHQFTAEELLGRAQSYLETDKQMDAAAKRAAALQIADLYAEFGVFKNAITIYETERKFAADEHDARAEAIALWNLSEALTFDTQFARAKETAGALGDLLRQGRLKSVEFDARLRLSLGRIALAEDDFVSAKLHYEEALKTLQALPNYPQLLLLALDGNSLAYQRAGSLATARAFGQRAISLQESAQDPSRTELTQRRTRLCQLDLDLENIPAAKKCYQAVVLDYDERFGVSHSLTRDARLRLSYAYLRSGEFALAQEAISIVLASGSTTPLQPFESGYADTLQAILDMYQGKTHEAITRLRAVLSTAQSPDSPNALRIRRTLGEALLRANHPQAAIEELERIQSAQVQLFGANSATVARTRLLLGIAYAQVGKIGAAQTLFHDALPTLREQLGENYPGALAAAAYQVVLSRDKTEWSASFVADLSKRIQHTLGWQSGSAQLLHLLRAQEPLVNTEQLPIVL